MGDISKLGKKAEDKIRQWLNKPEEGFFFYRIPDQQTGFYGSDNPCDFFLFKQPNFFLIESKATWEDRFDFSRITENQHKKMLEASIVNGVTSYVAILFATYKRMFLVDIKDISRMESEGIKSLNIKKINKWPTPFIEVRTLLSRKELLDYDPLHAIEVFGSTK